VLGHGPTLKDGAGKTDFFSIEGSEQVRFNGLKPAEIMHKVGYFADRLGRRYDARLEDGIDFTRNNWPSFLSDFSGLSNGEPWGRWSDANISRSVRFDFTSELPEKFLLILDISVFGPNKGQRMEVKVGQNLFKVVLPTGEGILEIPIANANHASFIEFWPPKPTSPAEMMISPDSRKLAIGFRKMIIKPE
jgi:hypothetical protein